MKILHWAIILVMIVLPTSIVCRINVNAKFSSLKDEVRINNAIDTATKDAIDQLISLNEVMSFDGEFGDVIDINPALAQAMIDTFFHSMAVNYNIAYKNSDASSNSEDSYIKNYFSSYIPAIMIVAYDGFYIYSLEQNGSNGYKYELSSKIPYAYEVSIHDEAGRTYNYSIGYTLGNDIYLYYNGKCYSGRLTDNSIDETKDKFEGYDGFITYYENSGLNGEISLADYISSFSNDMSSIIYALNQYGDKNGNYKVPFDDYLLPSDTSTTDFLQDYVYSGDGSIAKQAGDFQINRKKVIIDIITACLNEEINIDHNRYADLVGVTYDFSFPTLSQQDWMNTIDDISFLAFVQGIPMGNAKGEYYNNFALGGSKIVKKNNIYITREDNNILYYHTSKCKSLPRDENGNIDMSDDSKVEFEALSKREAATPRQSGGYGAYPCQLCN